MRPVPKINTRQLTLRPLRQDDFERFAEIWAKPDLIAQHPVAARCRAVAWDGFLRNAGHWSMVGLGSWGIEARRGKGLTETVLIGQVGFGFGSQRFGQDFDRFPEAEWIFDRQFADPALIKEATQAVHDWFDRVIIGPVVCRVGMSYPDAKALAAHLGYVPLRVVDDVQLMIRKSPP